MQGKKSVWQEVRNLYAGIYASVKIPFLVNFCGDRNDYGKAPIWRYAPINCWKLIIVHGIVSVRFGTWNLFSALDKLTFDLELKIEIWNGVIFLVTTQWRFGMLFIGMGWRARCASSFRSADWEYALRNSLSRSHAWTSDFFVNRLENGRETPATSPGCSCSLSRIHAINTYRALSVGFRPLLFSPRTHEGSAAAWEWAAPIEKHTLQ